jgi:hypothetical protein
MFSLFPDDGDAAAAVLYVLHRARVVDAERFEIETKNRVWSLQAHTAREAKLWVNALNFWLTSYYARYLLYISLLPLKDNNTTCV